MPTLTESIGPSGTTSMGDDYAEAMHMPEVFPTQSLRQGYTPAYFEGTPIQIDPNVWSVEPYSRLTRQDLETKQLESQRKLEGLSRSLDPTTISQYIHTKGPYLEAYDPDFEPGGQRYPVWTPQEMAESRMASRRRATAQPSGFGGLGGLMRGIVGLPLSILKGLGGALSPTQSGMAPTGLRRGPQPPQVDYWGRPIEPYGPPSRLKGMQRSPTRLTPTPFNVVGPSQQVTSSAPTAGSYQNTIR